MPGNTHEYCPVFNQPSAFTVVEKVRGSAAYMKKL